MAGQPGRSGGHNRLSLDVHRIRGSLRPHRHGALAAVPPATRQAIAPKQKRPAAPKHLSLKTRRWFKDMTAEWDFSAPHALRLLTAAAEALDRLDVARATVAAEGAIVRDRFGSPREHPAAKAARSEAALFAALVKDLRLEDA